ncbi:type II toxin -antitoxin system TacA 1-like antitoxin [Abyssibacter profundi]|uniref:Antitoxin ParD n=1 Tax=Abyssibacter profundi TaxID=2182787 RepID=A0A363UNE1_9GAMM|nr:DUF1778 domain-containing protein [Abyssibacter profundi]MBV61426.1 antitoxin [Nevskiales bacterium]PWN56959.1 antitoxin [Abyssibacter profundi]
MRLSIEVTPEQHQCLKAAAALQGKSLKAFVLERALSDLSSGGQADDLHALEQVLRARMDAAAKGSRSSKSVAEIADEVQAEENRA